MFISVMLCDSIKKLARAKSCDINHKRYRSVVACTDLLSQEHRQVGMGVVVISGSLSGGMVSTLICNSRYLGSISALGAILPISITLMTPVAMTMIMYKLHAVWLLNLPGVCKCKVIACMYVILSIKRLTIPGG